VCEVTCHKREFNLKVGNQGYPMSLEGAGVSKGFPLPNAGGRHRLDPPAASYRSCVPPIISSKSVLTSPTNHIS
jgi:hypothetical protein